MSHDKSWGGLELPAAASSGERPLTSLGIGLAELETFLAVVAEGSFSQAARRLSLSQPAVTTRIQKLEQTLGVRLLNRTTRSVTPTRIGHRLAQEAGETLQGLNRLVARTLEESGKARRRLTIATTAMVAAHLLPGVLRQWQAERPDIAVVIRDLRHQAVMESLDCGESDLAVIAIDSPVPRFRFQLLLDDEMVALAPPGHELEHRRSISLAEFAACPVMLLERYTDIQARIERACSLQGLNFAPSLVAANLHTIIGMLDTGAGLTVLPRVIAMHGQPGPRHCLAIEGIDLRRRYGILTRRDGGQNLALHRFCDFLRQRWQGFSGPAEMPGPQ